MMTQTNPRQMTSQERALGQTTGLSRFTKAELAFIVARLGAHVFIEGEVSADFFAETLDKADEMR